MENNNNLNLIVFLDGGAPPSSKQNLEFGTWTGQDNKEVWIDNNIGENANISEVRPLVEAFGFATFSEEQIAYSVVNSQGYLIDNNKESVYIPGEEIADCGYIVTGNDISIYKKNPGENGAVGTIDMVYPEKKENAFEAFNVEGTLSSK